MNKPTTPFAQKIKELLKEKGATQQELAEACSLTPGSISCWMAGAVPNAQLIIPIARFFGISVEEVLAPLSLDPEEAAKEDAPSNPEQIKIDPLLEQVFIKSMKTPIIPERVADLIYYYAQKPQFVNVDLRGAVRKVVDLNLPDLQEKDIDKIIMHLPEDYPAMFHRAGYGVVKPVPVQPHKTHFRKSFERAVASAEKTIFPLIQCRTASHIRTQKLFKRYRGQRRRSNQCHPHIIESYARTRRQREHHKQRLQFLITVNNSLALNACKATDRQCKASSSPRFGHLQLDRGQTSPSGHSMYEPRGIRLINRYSLANGLSHSSSQHTHPADPVNPVKN